MPSAMKAGLSGGAAANNVNVVQMHYGLKMLRYTDRKAGAYAARAAFTATTLNEFDAQAVFTVATS